MTTWNASIPAAANQIAADLPDIQENFDHLAQGSGGYIHGLVVSRESDTHLAISAGVVSVHDGTEFQQWTLASGTTKAHAGGVSKVKYVYIDPDAAGGGTYPALNSSNIVVNETAPTWSDSKGGLYDSNMRCIGWWFTDASEDSVYMSAKPDGVTQLRKEAVDICTDQVHTSFTGEVFTGHVPAIANIEVDITVMYTYVTAGGNCFWREYGQAAATGFRAGTVGAAATAHDYSFTGPIRLNGAVPTMDFKTSNAGAKYAVRLNGVRGFR